MGFSEFLQKISSEFLQETFNAAYGISIGENLASLLFNAIMAAAPNYFSAQTLSLISGISPITFLIGLANNPFLGALIAAIALIFTRLGKEVLSNLSSSPQTYAQTLFIIAYVTYIYSNAIFFFAHLISLVVQVSIIAPVVLVFGDVVISAFLISAIIYILMALGYISPDL